MVKKVWKILVTLLENLTNAPDNVAGMTSILHDEIQTVPHFVEIWRRTGEPAQTRLSICHNRCHGLVDFVSD